jgi:hypothetical protein
MRSLELIVPVITTLALVAGGAGTTLASSHAAHEKDQTALPRVTAPEGAEVYFITPTEGEAVSNPFTVRFGLRGMGVGPAGLDNPKTGHHHLIIDAPLPDLDMPIPVSDSYRHFGGGQTEVAIELEPGTHTLQLVLGDRNHIPHTSPLVSKKITITVK